MAGFGSIVGILIGLGQVWAAFTQPPPTGSVGIALLSAVAIGVVVFVAGLIAPVFTGTAAIGAMLGWVIAAVVYAIQTEWVMAVAVLAAAICVFLAQLGFGVIRARRESDLY